MRGAVLALMALVACDAAPGNQPIPAPRIVTADLPPGYPPKIGAVAAVLNGKAVAWDTYDYSVGAFDASAQFVGPKAMPEFRLLGMQPGQPGSDRNRLTMKGSGSGGALQDVLIEVVAGRDWNGLRLSSAGQKAVLVLDRVTGDGVSRGHVTGHFLATICAANGMPIKVDTRHCQAISATFETEFQYDLK